MGIPCIFLGLRFNMTRYLFLSLIFFVCVQTPPALALNLETLVFQKSSGQLLSGADRPAKRRSLMPMTEMAADIINALPDDKWYKCQAKTLSNTIVLKNTQSSGDGWTTPVSNVIHVYELKDCDELGLR
jgi:hypothetical protein